MGMGRLNKDRVRMGLGLANQRQSRGGSSHNLCSKKKIIIITHYRYSLQDESFWVTKERRGREGKWEGVCLFVHLFSLFSN